MATDPGIELRRLLSQMSGFSIGDRDYVSYFVNDSGERMIYVQKWGEGAAVLLHSDLAWEPQTVKGPPTTTAHTATAAQKKALSNVSIDGGLLDTPVCGGIILDRAEAQWLSACYSATEPLRDAR
ncbi:hypothetical protein K7472_09090 [Streptomyces sp. PTM05]|uniref:Uncharacterized protein n=1 Tax=Streptantibioticus parmotrematis TaxID=2873249 RepID=A0ABS7QP90_9ACTN|nr:hypothetical protein [Streptantibioticus parmotrematis]MBY8884998.1 hypothetical protein [Streptantibioticus parmotrematis]